MAYLQKTNEKAGYNPIRKGIAGVTAAAILASYIILPGCGNNIAKEQARENVKQKTEETIYRIGTVEVSNNTGISNYMGYEGKVLDYATRKNISDLIRQLNPNPKLYHSGFKDGEVSLHAGQKIRVPDINSDGKLFGKPMYNSGLETFVLTQDKNGKIINIDHKEAYNEAKAYSGTK